VWAAQYGKAVSTSAPPRNVASRTPVRRASFSRLLCAETWKRYQVSLLRNTNLPVAYAPRRDQAHINGSQGYCHS